MSGKSTGHSDQMWTSSERFYPNVDKFGTFLPKCGQDGSGYSKPLPLLFPVVVGNIAGDAPPPLILRLFLSFRLHEFEREIGGGSRARAGLRPKKKGRLVTHRRFPSQTHAAASSETAAVSKVAARLRRCSHPLPEKEEVAVSNIQSRLVHIWVKTFRTCSHLGWGEWPRHPPRQSFAEDSPSPRQPHRFVVAVPFANAFVEISASRLKEMQRS
ncbi:hypothetical protein LXL04_014430 [Taraxacum kok-saghyz]